MTTSLHLRAVLAACLSLLWMVLAYVGLQRAGQLFFTGRYRAQVAAAAVVLAFVVGFNWPRTALPQASADATVPTPQAATSPGIEVGAACVSAHVLTAKGQGHLDSASILRGSDSLPIGNPPTIRAGDVVVVRGWAADAKLAAPGIAVCLMLDGHIVAGLSARYGEDRPDVANAFHNPALSATGFEIMLPATRILPGRHRIGVSAIRADGGAAAIAGVLEINGP